MRKKELQEKIVRLEAELEEVKEMAETMKKNFKYGVFKPIFGQRYWRISGTGRAIKEVWSNHWSDHHTHEIGNCYPTKQAAEDTVRVQKLVQKVRESQDGFLPDWDNLGQKKYNLLFNSGSISVAVSDLMIEVPVFGLWTDKLVCEQFIQDNHDELLWFFTEYQRQEKLYTHQEKIQEIMDGENE